jgi:hypothetical protein
MPVHMAGLKWKETEDGQHLRATYRGLALYVTTQRGSSGHYLWHLARPDSALPLKRGAKVTQKRAAADALHWARKFAPVAQAAPVGEAVAAVA